MWLLESGVRQQIYAAQKAGVMPTAEQQIQFEASRHAMSETSSSRIMTMAGNTAEICIDGVLTKAPSLFMAMLFGGGNTSYSEITSALAEADASPEINEIILAIDSPGGSIDGLFEALAAIEAVGTPMRAVVSDTAASAAYAIAAAAGNITATNRAARFGSVGVVASFYTDEHEISITSTNAPNKRPDVTTSEGQSAIREELDALHDIFADSIAAGRGVSAQKINADFGQGATLLADEALKRGMIDAVAAPTLAVVSSSVSTTTATSGTQPEASNMDLNTLKAQHADVYAAAVQEGVSKERDRVGAHLIMGQQSGAVETAIKACQEGSEMTATLQATYMTAGMNRSDVQARQDDDADATAGDNANATDEESTQAAASKAIFGIAAESCGVELGA